MEGKAEPATDRTTPEYLEMKKKCQEDVGALLWISTRTRPDITCSISLIATLIVFHPREAFNLIKAVWRYLAATPECVLSYGEINYRKVKVQTDASFAPGGDRSRSGVTIFWRGGLVFWYSKRQPLTTFKYSRIGTWSIHSRD